jgi:hypothetical protein
LSLGARVESYPHLALLMTIPVYWDEACVDGALIQV